MSQGRLEARLERLRELRGADASTRVAALRRALHDPSNYLVAKAAELAGEADVALMPDLLAAYDAYFGDGVARDPQVWAKTAIARALRALGYRDPTPFVRGLHHVQLEAVWGRREDMAQNLRCVCAQALVDTDLAPPAALRELIPHLVDPFAVVRVEAVNAIAQIGGEEAALLLRLKAHAGDGEPEVVGACFVALLEREPSGAVAFITPFLAHDDDAVRAEAAAALALSRDPAALEALGAFLQQPLPLALRQATIAACAGCPQPAVVELLLGFVAGPQRAVAEFALRAIAQSRFGDGARARAWDAAVAAHGSELARPFEEFFGRPN